MVREISKSPLGPLPEDWRLAQLKNISEKIGSGATPKGGDSVYLSTRQRVALIRSQNVFDRSFDEQGLVYISDEHAAQLEGVSVQPDDILLNITGDGVTFGRACIVPEKILPACVNQHVTIIRPDPNACVSGYLLSYLTHPQIKLYIESFNAGGSRRAITKGHIESFEVPLPPLPEQRAIAHILGALDDKIELNRRMNATLEGMARALFKAWFVDFEPVRAKAHGQTPSGQTYVSARSHAGEGAGEHAGSPQRNAPQRSAPQQSAPRHLAELFPSRLVESELGEVPEGWEIKPLDQIANFLNGLALQKYPPEGDGFLPVIKIAQMRKGNTDGADKASASIDSAYIVNDGDVLFSWSGSLEVMLWCGGKGALNQHLFKVTSADYPKWFYYHWVLIHLPDFQEVAAGKATTMGHIQRHHLAEAKVFVPPTPLLQKMDEHFAPLIDRLIVNQLESHTLAALRDELLPKLVSGELRVREAGEHVGSPQPGSPQRSPTQPGSPQPSNDPVGADRRVGPVGPDRVGPDAGSPQQDLLP